MGINCFLGLVTLFLFSQARRIDYFGKKSYAIRYNDGGRIIPIIVDLDERLQYEYVRSAGSNGNHKAISLYDFAQDAVAFRDFKSRQCFVGTIRNHTLPQDLLKLEQLKGKTIPGPPVYPALLLDRSITPSELRRVYGKRIANFCNGFDVFSIKHEQPLRRIRRNKAESTPRDAKGKFTHHSYGHYGHQSTNYAHYGHESFMDGQLGKDGAHEQRISQYQVRSDGPVGPITDSSKDNQQIKTSQTSNGYWPNAGQSNGRGFPASQINHQRTFGDGTFPGGSGSFQLRSQQGGGYQVNLPFGLRADSTYNSGVGSRGVYGTGSHVPPQVWSDLQKTDDSLRLQGSSCCGPKTLQSDLASQGYVPAKMIPSGAPAHIIPSVSPQRIVPVSPDQRKIIPSIFPDGRTTTQMTEQGRIPSDGVQYRQGVPSQNIIPVSQTHHIIPSQAHPGQILPGIPHPSQLNPDVPQQRQVIPGILQPSGYIPGSVTSREQTPGMPSTGLLQPSIYPPTRTTSDISSSHEYVPGIIPPPYAPGLQRGAEDQALSATRHGRRPAPQQSSVLTTQDQVSSGHATASRVLRPYYAPDTAYLGQAYPKVTDQAHRMTEGAGAVPVHLTTDKTASGYVIPSQMAVGPQQVISIPDSHTSAGHPGYIQQTRDTFQPGQYVQGILPPAQLYPTDRSPPQSYISGQEGVRGFRSGEIPSESFRRDVTSTSLHQPGQFPIDQRISRPGSFLPGEMPSESFRRDATGTIMQQQPGQLPAGQRITRPGRFQPGEITSESFPRGLTGTAIQQPGQLPVDQRISRPGYTQTFQPGVIVPGYPAAGISRPGNIEGRSRHETIYGGQDTAGSQTQVQTGFEGTAAEASSQGRHRGLGSQTQVQGGYTGNGSFSAQAQSGFTGGITQSQVRGSKQGGTSTSSAQVETLGSAQSQVQVLQPSGVSSGTAQGRFDGGSTQVQAQSGKTGGSAGAQAQSSGLSSSQVQVNVDGESVKASDTFQGGVSASVLGGRNSGQSQTQLQGGYTSGRTYVATAQGGYDLAQFYQPGSIPQRGSIPGIIPPIAEPEVRRVSTPETNTRLQGSPRIPQNELSSRGDFNNVPDTSPLIVSTRNGAPEGSDSISVRGHRPPVSISPSQTGVPDNAGLSIPRVPVPPSHISDGPEISYRDSLPGHRPSVPFTPAQISGVPGVPGSAGMPGYRTHVPVPRTQTSGVPGVLDSVGLAEHRPQVSPPQTDLQFKPEGPTSPQSMGFPASPGLSQFSPLPGFQGLPASLPDFITPSRSYQPGIPLPQSIPHSTQPGFLPRPDLSQPTLFPGSPGFPQQTQDISDKTRTKTPSDLGYTAPRGQEYGRIPGIGPQVPLIPALPQQPSHLRTDGLEHRPGQSVLGQDSTAEAIQQFQPGYPIKISPDGTGQYRSELTVPIATHPTYPGYALGADGNVVRLPVGGPPQFPAPLQQGGAGPSGQSYVGQLPGRYPSQDRSISRPDTPADSHLPIVPESSFPGGVSYVPSIPRGGEVPETPKIPTSAVDVRTPSRTPPAVETLPESSQHTSKEQSCCQELRNLRKRCCGSKARDDTSQPRCCTKKPSATLDYDEEFEADNDDGQCKVVKAVCYIVYKPIGRARICKPTSTTINGC